MISSNVPATG